MFPIVAGPSPGRHRPGSQQALRQSNAQRILQVLTGRGPQTQAELGRITGLSGGTISNIVRSLVDAEMVQTTSTVVGGRRAIQVSILSTSRYLLGIDIGRSHLNILITDSLKTEVCRHNDSLRLGHSANETLKYVGTIVRRLREDNGIRLSDIDTCVIALPASVHPQHFSIVQDMVFHAWADLDLKAMAEKYLGMPVFIENDANLGALAQVSYGNYVGVSNLMYLKVASGIGIGMVHNFSDKYGSVAPQSAYIYSSSSGVTGEIGHTQVVQGGEICCCGNRGCLETVASVPSLITGFQRIRPDDEANIERLIDAALRQDIAVTRMLNEAGTTIGRAIAPLLNVLAPDAVVLGGPLLPVGNLLLHAMVPVTKQLLLPALAHSTEFSVSPLGAQTEVLGCIALASQIMWNAVKS